MNPEERKKAKIIGDVNTIDTTILASEGAEVLSEEHLKGLNEK